MEKKLLPALPIPQTPNKRNAALLSCWIQIHTLLCLCLSVGVEISLMCSLFCRLSINPREIHFM
uniref:Uncharacterized protein n=1 Tax=Amphiprion ocellaris TaxID=80972 RepID=A0AAQ5YB02_AMPOC